MGKILIKSGVSPRSFTIIAAVANVTATLPHDVTITAGTDGRHRPDSKHYTQEAVDIRSKNFPSLRAKQDFISAVLFRLGPGYEMFLEHVSDPDEHFHCEWDPK